MQPLIWAHLYTGRFRDCAPHRTMKASMINGTPLACDRRCNCKREALFRPQSQHPSSILLSSAQAMEESESSVGLFKITAALLLFCFAVVGGLLPQKLKNIGSKVVSCLNTAAGGVFLASAMVRTIHELGVCSELINS